MEEYTGKVTLLEVSQIMEKLCDEDINTIVGYLIACKTLLKVNGVKNVKNVDRQADKYAKVLWKEFNHAIDAGFTGDIDKED